MGIVALLFLLTAIGAVTTFATRAPAQVRWYERGLRERALHPEAVGADGYRGALFQAPIETVAPILTEVAQLPQPLREAAAACRIAFFGGVFSVLPVALGVVVEVFSGGPSAACLLGVPGLALSFAQLMARRALFAPLQHNAELPRLVAMWTLLHNAVVAVLVVVTSFGLLAGTWTMFRIDVLGLPSLLYIAFSVWLGVALLRASRVVQAELALADA